MVWLCLWYWNGGNVCEGEDDYMYVADIDGTEIDVMDTSKVEMILCMHR